jgi:hypothetical protein
MVVLVIHRDGPTALVSIVAPDRVRDDHNRHPEKYRDESDQ